MTRTLPNNNKEYGTKQYWDERFKQEESYEWLVSYSDIQEQLSRLIPNKVSKILIIGCGNSPFSFDMYMDGYTNITNIDYSQAVIDAMQQKQDTILNTTTISTNDSSTILSPNSRHCSMVWLVMDMTDMSTLMDNTFDVVIDKAAMDAIMTLENDVWYPNESVILDAYKTCSHIQRILQPINGIYLQISFAQPHFRTKYLLGTHYQQRIHASANEHQPMNTQSLLSNYIHEQQPIHNSDNNDSDDFISNSTTKHDRIDNDRNKNENNHENDILNINIEYLNTNSNSNSNSNSNNKDDDEGEYQDVVHSIETRENDVTLVDKKLQEPYPVTSSCPVGGPVHKYEYSQVFKWYLTYETVGLTAFQNFLYIMRKQ